MTSILCHRCKRPNALSARTCIWCRAEVSEGAPALQADSTSIEADYLEGVARLDDPGPVRLIISGEGIEIVELVPGSRSIKIPAGAIVQLSSAHSEVGRQNTESEWWRSALEPLRVRSAGRNRANEERDFMLEVEYRAGDEVRKALFRYSDRGGHSIARRLEQILGKLAANGDHGEDKGTQG